MDRLKTVEDAERGDPVNWLLPVRRETKTDRCACMYLILTSFLYTINVIASPATTNPTRGKFLPVKKGVAVVEIRSDPCNCRLLVLQTPNTKGQSEKTISV